MTGQHRKVKDEGVPVHTIKAYRTLEAQLHSFLSLGSRSRWGFSFTLRPVYPTEHAHNTHWIGGWVGLQSWSGH